MRALLVLLVACSAKVAWPPDAAPVVDASLPPAADAARPRHAGVRQTTLADLPVWIFYPTHAPAARAELDLAASLGVRTRRALPLSVGAALDAPAEPGEHVVFLHGYGLHPLSAASLAVRWAEAGYVAVLPRLPGMSLGDVLARRSRAHTLAAARRLLAALPSPPVALVGHSDGGELAAGLADTPSVRVVVSMAQSGTEPVEARDFLTVILSAADDEVERAVKQDEGLAASPTPRVLVRLRRGGHLVFTDDCEHGTLERVQEAGVRLSGFPAWLAPRGCRHAAPEGRTDLLARLTLAAFAGDLATLTGAASWPEILEVKR